jgi:glycine/D-amino acid oxidase-like deaminating enzyme
MQHVRSYYAASANPAPLREPLEGETTADVCVVGGGIAGCSTALHLAERPMQLAQRIGDRHGRQHRARQADHQRGDGHQQDRDEHAVGRGVQK